MSGSRGRAAGTGTGRCLAGTRGGHPVQRSTRAGAGAGARSHPRADQVPGGEADPPTGAGRWTDKGGHPPGAPRAWQGPGGGTGSFFVERDFERRLKKEPGRPTNPETDQRPVTAGISGARAKGGERVRPGAPPGVPLRGLPCQALLVITHTPKRVPSRFRERSSPSCLTSQRTSPPLSVLSYSTPSIRAESNTIIRLGSPPRDEA